MNLSIEDVRFTYPSGTEALRGITFGIDSGEAVAIIGENGAGKSTLAKHLNGLLRPTSGQVIVGEWNTRDYTVARMAARVGYVFQNPDDQLLERTVEEEVAFGPRNLKHSPEEIKAGVAAALERVGLAAEAKIHPYDLTASQRKLVTLASVLAMGTPIIILDEPTMGQDAAGVRRIGAIVEALKAEGRTVLTISHDIDFCAEHFGRVIVMANGQVLDDGPATDVLCRQDLLATTNVEPPQMIRLAQALGLNSAPLTPEAFVRALGS
jgi:energy-coupling factor transport system ATP-binding protein